MAGPYYVDPAASGNNDGSDWTNAWTSLQTAADTAAAGDTVYCRGTQNLSAAIDFDTNSGTYDGGYIKFIGCNASGVNDGTRFTLKRTANSINGIYINGKHFVWLENISVEDCPLDGIASSVLNSDFWRFINVQLYNNANCGVNSNLHLRYCHYQRCHISGNGGDGVYKPTASQFTGCVFADNGGDGCEQVSQNHYSNCIFHNNTGYGIIYYSGAIFINCVVDGNAGGGLLVNNATQYLMPMLIGCRITNHNGSGKLGVEVTGNTRVGLLSCYFGNNATDITADRYEIIPINGSTARCSRRHGHRWHERRATWRIHGHRQRRFQPEGHGNT